jgi:hypothetical protein
MGQGRGSEQAGHSGVADGFHGIDRDPGPRREVSDQRGKCQHGCAYRNEHGPFDRADPIELGAKENGAANAEQNSDGRYGSGNAQSHTDAQFFFPRADRIGDRPKQTDYGQQQSQGAQNRNTSGRYPLG